MSLPPTDSRDSDPELSAAASGEMPDGAALRHLPKAVIGIDAAGVVTVVNPAFEKLFHLSAERLLGKPLAEVPERQPSLGPLGEALLAAMGDPGPDMRRDLEVRVGGDLRHLSVRTSRLPGPGGGLLAAISDNAELARMRRTQWEASRLLLMLMITFAIAMIASHLISEHVTVAQMSKARIAEEVGWAYMAVLALPALSGLFLLKLPLSAFGVTTRNWRRALREAAIASALGAAALIAAVLFVRTFLLPDIADKPLFDPGRLALPYLGQYLVVAAMQEFLVRGVLQGTLQRVLGPGSGLLSVFLVSLLFGCLHVLWGPELVAAAFVSSYILGWLYFRHGTLIGVVIVHFVLGTVTLNLVMHLLK